jgi:hypothetical protein
MDLNFDRERALLQQKKAELAKELTHIDQVLTALNSGRSKGRKAVQVDNVAVDGAIVHTRRPMSPKAKQAARQRMLAYWAAKRAAAKPKSRSSKPTK